MLVEEAKKILATCSNEQKERFAIIGILQSARLFEQLLSVLEDKDEKKLYLD